MFQTLIDISNNPEVKQFLYEHKKDLIINNNDNYDFRNAFQKINKQNPRLMKSILFTRPKMTYIYLDKTYDNGIELINILGEDKALEIIEFVSLSNTELLDKSNNIIMNNKELSYRVSELIKLNTEIKLNFPLLEYPNICAILFLIFLSLSLPYAFFSIFYQIFQNSILRILVIPWMIMLEIILDPIFILLVLLGCLYIPPVP